MLGKFKKNKQIKEKLLHSASDEETTIVGSSVTGTINAEVLPREEKQIMTTITESSQRREINNPNEEGTVITEKFEK